MLNKAGWETVNHNDSESEDEEEGKTGVEEELKKKVKWRVELVMKENVTLKKLLKMKTVKKMIKKCNYYLG